MPLDRASREEAWLQKNDVILTLEGDEPGGGVVIAATISRPEIPFNTQLVSASSLRGFRPANMTEGISALAALIYRLSLKTPLHLLEARRMGIPLLTEQQAEAFLMLLKKTIPSQGIL